MQLIHSLVPRKPRQRPSPSQRDQQIYVEYQITGCRQAELAEKHRLTQSRVSQIIRRVAAWLANSNRAAAGDLAHVQQKRLDRWLEHERLQFVCREAMHHFQQQQKHIAHKHGQRDDKKFDETTERLLPPNLQYLKVVLAAIAQLSKLDEKPPLPFCEPDERERQGILFEELRRLRRQAEREGRVSPSHGQRTVEDAWLRALVGEPNDSRRHDPAACELSRAILPACERPSAVEPEGEAPAAWEGEAPAEPCGAQPRFPTAHRSTYAESNVSPQSVAGEQFIDDPPAKKTQNSTSAGAFDEGPISRDDAEAFNRLQRQWNSPPPPVPLLPGQKPRTPFEDPVERRRRHFLRLDDMRDARRRGLPTTFTFYPEDGPMPGDPPYVLDGAPPATGCDPDFPGTMCVANNEFSGDY